MGLQPFAVLYVEVLQTFEAAHDQIEPTHVYDVPALFLGEFGEESLLDVLED